MFPRNVEAKTCMLMKSKKEIRDLSNKIFENMKKSNTNCLEVKEIQNHIEKQTSFISLLIIDKGTKLFISKFYPIIFFFSHFKKCGVFHTMTGFDFTKSSSDI